MNKKLMVIILTGLISLAACNVSATPTLSPLPTTTLVSPASAPSSIIEIGDDDKGKTLTASVGARIRVVLHSTYWQFADGSSQAIKQLGDPRVVPDLTVSVPGSGAGTVTVEYQAIAPGQATIQASRTSCGEALLCAEDQRAWQVTIIVK